MKHPLFDLMGDDYPIHLEQQFDRILSKIESLWDTPDIYDYFGDLLIDQRGGRQGFPQEVLNEIIRLREFRELETLHQGDREVVDLFVRANFKVQSPDEDGTPPILVALKKGYTVVAQILLKAGADVNGKDRLGLAPLLLACGKPTIGYRAIAEALVMKGAFINIRDRPEPGREGRQYPHRRIAEGKGRDGLRRPSRSAVGAPSGNRAARRASNPACEPHCGPQVYAPRPAP